MALSNQQKHDMLDNLINSSEQDLFSNQMQLMAFEAELSAASNDANKQAAQSNIDNTNNRIGMLNARISAWKNEQKNYKS